MAPLAGRAQSLSHASLDVFCCQKWTLGQNYLIVENLDSNAVKPFWKQFYSEYI